MLASLCVRMTVTNSADRRLLHDAVTLVTKCVAFIYYKIPQPYYKMPKLLQNASFVQNATEHDVMLVKV